MLRTYGPQCDGRIIDAKVERIPDDATWIDLEEPTHDEEHLVEQCIRVDVPTQAEMAEIEPSSRLYEENGALYMTVSALRGLDEHHPTTTPIGFVLAGNRLVTVRYASPKPIRAFENHARRDRELVKDGPTVLVRMLDAIIDRLADEIENVGAKMEELSQEIFQEQQDERRIPAEKLTALLTRIGRTQILLTKIRYSAVSTLRMLSFFGASNRVHEESAAELRHHLASLTRIGRTQILLTKIRYSAVSTLRMLSFFGASNRVHEESAAELRHHLASLTTDVTSLSEHASFLSDNLTFLLDASLGLISIEQNAAMKLFSWAAVVFLPPTLIAGIFGMNFHYMPELSWHYGYPLSLALMLVSAVGPYLYFKRRGWI